MKPTKQTVYFPTEEALKKGFSSSDFDRKTGYFFTPEQLNEYTQNVIKQALETAADNASLSDESCESFGENQVSYYIDEESITNTFDKTFKKFEV